MQNPHKVQRLAVLTLAVLGVGCAPTTAPLPPPAEFLLVVNTQDASLSILPLPDAVLQARINLGIPVAKDASVAANRRYAVVATGGAGIAVVDLLSSILTFPIVLPAGARVLDVAFFNDSIAFLADGGRDRLIRLNVFRGDTLSVEAAGAPNGVALSRGRLFVLNGNLTPCLPAGSLCPGGPSWITVFDPSTLVRAGGIDSIPLPGPGGGRFLRPGGDGFVYVISEGNGTDFAGRLAIIDPVRRAEIGNFGGLGVFPGWFAADRGERLLVSSTADGLMEFNTRTRSVVRGAGNGIPVQQNTGVAVDSRGDIYAVEAGPCDGVANGRVRHYRPDLTERRVIPLGKCPVGAAIAFIPPAEVAQAQP